MKRMRGITGLLFAGALLLAACGRKNEDGAEEVTVFPPEEEMPITETYFPDAAFREYLWAYVDKDRNGKLSTKERGAVEGLGSVKSEGGLLDGNYILESNIERGSKLRAAKSLEGIQYFMNLREICFGEGYNLEKLPLDNPKLETVQIEAVLQNFSIGCAPELYLLAYAAQGKQDIAWDGLAKLTDLRINGAEIKMEDLAKCRELTSLSLSGCVVTMPENPEVFDFPRLSTMKLETCDLRIPENLETLAFSRIPLLEEFFYSEPEGKGGMAVREFDFGKNEYLKEVVFHAEKMAKRVILGNIDTYFWVGPEWTGCEVVFEDETMLQMEEPLPEGSIWLTAENFPDVGFRQYLYHYADKDKDHILTKEERGNIREMERAALLKRIYRFDGIQYLENLTTFCLDQDSVAVSICLDNPRLQELSLPGGLEEFSIKNPESLQFLYFYSKKGLRLDLSGMRELRVLNIENVSADFSYLLQNKYLTRFYLRDCVNLGETLEEYDFSAMKELGSVHISPKKGTKLWAERMCFGDSGYFSEDPDAWAWIWLDTDVAGKVLLENKNIHCRAEGAEIVYLDDVFGEGVGVLPEGSIWNGTEKIADMGFRCYIHQELDVGRDNILTLQERECLASFVDTGYDYDYGPYDEVNEYKWKMEDDMNPYVRGITSLRGFEYFPKLKRLQLEEMQLAEDVREIVITNPELEVLDLRFNGNVETIDLTACKKLRICVIDSARDAGFVQEVKPTILLPGHLKLETVEGMDCVVGEKAQERFQRRGK